MFWGLGGFWWGVGLRDFGRGFGGVWCGFGGVLGGFLGVFWGFGVLGGVQLLKMATVLFQDNAAAMCTLSREVDCASSLSRCSSVSFLTIKTWKFP